jgi:phage-related minor tail protein
MTNSDQQANALNLERVLEVIREELSRALKPVADGQARLELMIGATYTREITDLKVNDLQRQLNELRTANEELKKQIGGFWQNALLRASGVAGLTLALIELFKGFKW